MLQRVATRELEDSMFRPRSLAFEYFACALSLMVGVACIGEAQTRSAARGGTPQGDVVSRFVQAMQRQDFKIVIDLTAPFQSDVAAIKARNPQVLWNQLVADYYQQKT